MAGGPLSSPAPADVPVGVPIGLQRLWFFADGGQPWGFDCVVKEGHHSELKVTDNPVETGVTISDHAYMEPLRLEIEAAVGDAWMDSKGSDGNRVSDVWASALGRSVSAFAMLQGLQASAVPFSVQTGLKLYTSMLITSLDADQDAASSSILHFRASLRSVQFVSTQTVNYPPRAAGKTTNSASKTVSRGSVSTTPVTDPAKEKSIIFSFTGR